jgi:ParB-like chromosome segregation protein Spo0J
METHPIPLENIYVPTKRRQTLDAAKVEELAESVMEDGIKVPIQVRKDGDRVVLVEGLHRLEAARALGEATILSIYVGAKRF